MPSTHLEAQEFNRRLRQVPPHSPQSTLYSPLPTAPSRNGSHVKRRVVANITLSTDPQHTQKKAGKHQLDANNQHRRKGNRQAHGLLHFQYPESRVLPCEQEPAIAGKTQHNEDAGEEKPVLQLNATEQIAQRPAPADS